MSYFQLLKGIFLSLFLRCPRHT